MVFISYFNEFSTQICYSDSAGLVLMINYFIQTEINK